MNVLRLLPSPKDDLGHLILIGYSLIVLLALIFLAWSFTVPLAKSSLVQGSVTVGRDRQTIVHPEGGKIDQVHVQVGDIVQKGQVLLELDDRTWQSELSLLEYQRRAKHARLDRLEAERQSMPSPVFRQSLLEEAKSNSMIEELIEGEKRNFEARREAFRTKNAILDHEIKKSSERDKTLHLQLRSIERQLTIVRQQSDNANKLWSRGFGTKAQSIALQREVEDLISQHLNIEGQIDEVTGAIRDAELNKQSHEANLVNEIEHEKFKIADEMTNLNERINITRNKLREMTIFASAGGIVVDLHIRSANDVVLPASPIIEIVPQNAQLIVEASIPPHEIDGIYEGTNVEVRFSAFASKDIPKINGKVSVVSADVIEDGKDSHYQIHVTINDWKNITGNLDVMPGMPVDIIIKKRSRTLMQYIATPIANNFTKAFL